MDAMKYNDLRDFLTLLEQQGELKRITLPVDPHLEITEIADRTLRAGGPALLFENPKGYSMPVLCNLFGTPKRVAMGMGQEDVSALREVGKLLAFLKEPEPPKGFRDLFDKLPQFKQVLNMPTKRLRGAPCQQKIVSGDDVDLNRIPIMTCWPEDAAPLITWGRTFPGFCGAGCRSCHDSRCSHPRSGYAFRVCVCRIAARHQDRSGEVYLQ